MTALSFTHETCEPYGTPALEIVTISRDVLAALVASASHLTERYDITLGNTESNKVSWQCRADCPVCLAKAALGDEGLL